MKKLICIAIAGLALAVSVPAVAGGIDTFREAKRALERDVYFDHAQSFYCDCSFAESDGTLRPDRVGCGVLARKNEERSNRIEWEHVVPASVLGGELQCWKDGGRRGCRSDPQFRAMESDMHNLVPAVGELNGDRANYDFGLVSFENRQYGNSCDFEVSFTRDVVEPRPAVRGDIARTYFYMAHRYGLRLSREQEAMFRRWSAADPIDDWERLRAARIERLQGNRNTFVSDQ